ncbi:85/88 kDa calcium-independent phospholipase A2 [Nematostella vectensis]|uniref:85/88 kDa calcium-independent phospholipase A2 n=1 Tax=Nematostella vectensis TaxID=45351 RepID=UPI0020777145|nr:85/88 kDa calcium-independent phospholipase A2 [Nematostella vectensis]
MGASPSSFRVDEANPLHYSYAKVLEKEGEPRESFTLYQVTSCRFEAVLNSDRHPKCFSLFRMDEEKAAREKFRYLYKNLAPFYQSSTRCLNAGTLQEVITCIEQHPDWSLAQVAKSLDLPECLKHDDIAASEKDNNATPLHLAVRSGKVDFIQKAIRDFDPSSLVKDKLGNTPLHYAAENYPEILTSVIQKAQLLHGQLVDVINSRNKDDQTALDVACRFTQDEGVRVLLEAGADVNHVNGYALPIHTALKANGTRCASLLIDFHPELISARDLKYGGSPLHWVKTKEAVEILLEKGADMESRNNAGETALHVMARRRRVACIVALLAHGVAVDAACSEGCTALHVAAEVDDPDIVRALIVFGANINVTNHSHHTPRHIATAGRRQRWVEVVEALGFVGAGPCDTRQSGCTLECSKTFQGTVTIGVTPNQVTSGLFGLPVYEDLFRLAAAAAVLGSGKGKDAVDGKSVKSASSIYKQKHKKDAILTLDGGGIRGLVLTQLLSAIEEVSGQSINSLFDWISGTSIGGIIALALVHGKSVSFCQGFLFRMKDKVFKGPRPYDTEPLEKLLQETFGENTKMTAVTHPKTLVTAVLADRRPATLYFFRNYNMPEDLEPIRKNNPFPPPPVPAVQQVWRAARGSGAAPTFFRAMGRFLDGGLIANNPTLDVLSEVHKYYCVHEPHNKKGPGNSNIGLVVSLGTGVPPPEHVPTFDVFKPETMWDATNVLLGARALGLLMVDQATATNGAVVDRARAWCEMIGSQYFRFSSPMSADVGLDETDDRILVKMLWETRVYILQNLKEFKKASEALT